MQDLDELHLEVPDAPAAQSRFWLTAPVLFGLAISIICLHLVSTGDKTNFSDLALKSDQVSYFATVGGKKIHCSDLVDANSCLVGVREADHQGGVLWLGNSQVHAINSMEPGQENAPPILFRNLQRLGQYLVTFSQPNASLQEHYLLIEYLRSRANWDTLVLSIVFDDLREQGIRHSLSGALTDSDTIKNLEQTDAGRLLLASDEADFDYVSDVAGLSQTPQERAELVLSGVLAEHSLQWNSRPELRGRLFHLLYKLRNYVFGISASTKRKMIPGRYQVNLQALDAILDAANADDIALLLVIVPLRSDIDTPYDQVEYAAFKEQVELLAHAKNANFANLEDLVPGDQWGTKESTAIRGEQELDFMHFTAAGHELLAEELYRQLTGLRSSQELYEE